MKMNVWMAVSAGVLSGATGLSNASIAEPSQKVLSRAVTQFLVDHGDLCMAKYTWPRDVTPEDQQGQTNDSLQLPVLEQLGLAKSKDVPLSTTDDAPAPQTDSGAPAVARRYWLTDKGQKYFLMKKRTTLGIHGDPEEHAGDFCIASLTLDKVIKWTPPDSPKQQSQRIVSYTYHIKAAEWMADPAARKVFPIVDRIIQGAGKLEMTATVQLKNGKWVPAMPGA